MARTLAMMAMMPLCADAFLSLSAPASSFVSSSPALRPQSLRSSTLAQAKRTELKMSCPLVPLVMHAKRGTILVNDQSALQGANIIVTLDKASGEKMTDSGILVAASVKSEGPQTGVVQAVGSGWVTEQGAKVPIEEVKVIEPICAVLLLRKL
eukprot:768568-Hanusia_phi.AAC.7